MPGNNGNASVVTLRFASPNQTGEPRHAAADRIRNPCGHPAEHGFWSNQRRVRGFWGASCRRRADDAAGGVIGRTPSGSAPLRPSTSNPLSCHGFFIPTSPPSCPLRSDTKGNTSLICPVRPGKRRGGVGIRNVAIVSGGGVPVRPRIYFVQCFSNGDGARSSV